MLPMYAFLVLSMIHIARCVDGYLPPYIKPCDFKANDLSNCIKVQIQEVLPKFAKGIPEMNIASLDPTHLNNITIEGNGLNLIFSDPDMHGVSTSKVTDFDISLAKGQEKLSISFKVDLRLTSQYEIDGRILILPIKGKGDAIVEAQGVLVNLDCGLNIIEDDLGKHLKLAIPKYNYTIEKTVFDLKNLFNGNKELAQSTLMFANMNWQQLMDELSPPAIKQIIKQVVKVINKFFAQVTIAQIVTGYE